MGFIFLCLNGLTQTPTPTPTATPTSTPTPTNTPPADVDYDDIFTQPKDRGVFYKVGLMERASNATDAVRFDQLNAATAVIDATILEGLDNLRYFKTINADSGNIAATTNEDQFNLVGGENIRVTAEIKADGTKVIQVNQVVVPEIPDTGALVIGVERRSNTVIEGTSALYFVFDSIADSTKTIIGVQDIITGIQIQDSQLVVYSENSGVWRSDAVKFEDEMFWIEPGEKWVISLEIGEYQKEIENISSPGGIWAYLDSEFLDSTQKMRKLPSVDQGGAISADW